jgi:hypothetical protein
MDDEFLSGFRKSPSAEFSQSLYAKLDQENRAQDHCKTVIKRVSLVFLGACLVFALLMEFSPVARTAAQTAFKDIIARIFVNNTTVFVNNIPVDVSKLPQESESYNTVWTPLSPEDISTDYPIFARLPAWVPAGYKLQERAALAFVSPSLDHPPVYALFEWGNRIGEIIQLIIYNGTCPVGQDRNTCASATSFSVGINSEPQVVAVNDQPGVIFNEVLYLANLTDPVQNWNPERGKLVPKGTMLSWDDDKTMFWLMTNSQRLSRHNLIRMAESIP